MRMITLLLLYLGVAPSSLRAQELDDAQHRLQKLPK